MQASFIVRHPEALYYALLLREAWFEWDAAYMQQRLDLPFRRVGYEELLRALEQVDWASLPTAVRSVGQPLLSRAAAGVRKLSGAFHGLGWASAGLCLPFASEGAHSGFVGAARTFSPCGWTFAHGCTCNRTGLKSMC
ncbi:MAG: hypothetical protein KatS3mg026_1333 [Bacteroidia bacterium]|nr:MAG: hypothetical protein KatS3mg026_1333 [Bacteroidia bacterium]